MVVLIRLDWDIQCGRYRWRYTLLTQQEKRADALSRYPSDLDDIALQPEAVLVALCIDERTAKDGEDTFGGRQREDLELLQMIEYLETGRYLSGGGDTLPC